jgi:hypothetical protein
MSTKTIRNFAIALVAMLGAGSAFGFMAVQVREEGRMLNAQLEVLGEQEAQESSYMRLQRISEETAEERTKLRSYFLEQEGDSVDLLNYIDSLAVRSGIYLQTKGLDLADGDRTNKWIKATFTIAGSETQVRQFVEILETLPYVQRMTALTLKAKSSTQWEADVTILVQILNYGG